MSDFATRPAPGTRVRVEFEGVVEPEPHDGYPRFWQVCVSDKRWDEEGGRIHYVNWESGKVTKLADPPPPVPPFWPPEDEDVWRTLDGADYYVDDGRWFSPRMHIHYTINADVTVYDGWALVYRKGVVEA